MTVKYVSDLDIKELEIYTELNEPQLLHYFEPDTGIFIAETPQVIKRALDAGCRPLSFLVEERLLKGSAASLIEGCGDIPVFAAPLNVISTIIGYKMTRGMLCAMYRPKEPLFDQLSYAARHIVLLEDIENPTNIGALFRSAAALGADLVILTPDCADPLYRRASRVSMGTVFQVPWLKISADIAIDHLKQNGFTVISMALTDTSVPLNSPALRGLEKSVVIFGNESTGITECTLLSSDHIVRIPMKNGVDSLNVASAGAVAFWQLFT